MNEHRQLQASGIDFQKRAASGEPFDGIITGRLPLIWAHAQLVYEAPTRKKVEHGDMLGKLMQRSVANAAMAVKSELLLVTPFLIPDEGRHAVV